MKRIMKFCLLLALLCALAVPTFAGNVLSDVRISDNEPTSKPAETNGNVLSDFLSNAGNVLSDFLVRISRPTN